GVHRPFLLSLGSRCRFRHSNGDAEQDQDPEPDHEQVLLLHKPSGISSPETNRAIHVPSGAIRSVGQHRNWCSAVVVLVFPPFAPEREEDNPARNSSPQSSLERSEQLSDLDQMPVGGAHVAASPHAPVDRRSQKLCSTFAPLLVSSIDVSDAEVHEGRGVMWI